jgi:hypothetical protein
MRLPTWSDARRPSRSVTGCEPAAFNDHDPPERTGQAERDGYTGRPAADDADVGLDRLARCDVTAVEKHSAPFPVAPSEIRSDWRPGTTVWRYA